MTVYTNECFIKFSNDPQRKELLNKSMIALVSCVSEFVKIMYLFKSTKSKNIVSLVTLIGEILLDSKLTFTDVLYENDIASDFDYMTEYVRN